MTTYDEQLKIDIDCDIKMLEVEATDLSDEHKTPKGES